MTKRQRENLKQQMPKLDQTIFQAAEDALIRLRERGVIAHRKANRLINDLWRGRRKTP